MGSSYSPQNLSLEEETTQTDPISIFCELPFTLVKRVRVSTSHPHLQHQQSPALPSSILRHTPVPLTPLSLRCLCHDALQGGPRFGGRLLGLTLPPDTNPSVSKALHGHSILLLKPALSTVEQWHRATSPSGTSTIYFMRFVYTLLGPCELTSRWSKSK